jgi:hypothetical protein
MPDHLIIPELNLIGFSKLYLISYSFKPLNCIQYLKFNKNIKQVGDYGSGYYKNIVEEIEKGKSW